MYVGRLTKLKGVDKLIKFTPEVLREYRNAELHIIGSDLYKAILRIRFVNSLLKIRYLSVEDY